MPSDVDRRDWRQERAVRARPRATFEATLWRAPIALAALLFGVAGFPGQDQAREVAEPSHWQSDTLAAQGRTAIDPWVRPRPSPPMASDVYLPEPLTDPRPLSRNVPGRTTADENAQEVSQKSLKSTGDDRDMRAETDAATVAAYPPANKDLRGTLADAPKLVSRRAFPQWSGVMEKSWAWDIEFDEACGDIVGQPCGLRTWQSFLETLRGTSPAFQLAQVSKQINQVRYREDIDNWGDLDYWAAPGEFFVRGGDCEDFAIAKYYSLRMLGFSPAQMRIVVLRDEARQVPHAVLVVEQEGHELVLDNMSDQIVPWNALPAYHPYYSVNEDAYWLHRGGDLS